jgi:predicted CXXCH cytochrome family protein
MKFCVSLLCVLPVAVAGAETGYVGRNVCEGCHTDIARTQARTAMAHTWQGRSAGRFSASYSETHEEGPDPPIDYHVRRAAQGLQFEIRMPQREPLDLPVEAIVGGERHGISFLLRVHDIDGSALPRAPLVEARYLHYAPENRLERSPGFPEEKPSSYETAIGRVLAPNFERKCLTCHGEPRARGTHLETGITCESCHGPGQPHLIALARRSADKGILNPKKLPVAERMRPCSQCHAGFSTVEDPMPDDLLISDQVTALSNSECWRQSAGQITCTNCHDPHQDAPRTLLVTRSEKTCLGCHGSDVTNHAGVCPVNRAAGCVGCHMPNEVRNPFLIADHWIRVHPEQNVLLPQHNAAWRTTVVPKRFFLRMMVLDDREKAAVIRQQLLSGGSFFELARANSVDRNSALNGGFLGDLAAEELDPGWASAALHLQPGEMSDVIEAQRKFFIVQRMPRNFREEAEARFNRAMELRKQRETQQSATELLEALKIYPHLLRALTYLGVTYAEAGNPQAGAGVLTVATRLYPQDAGAHFNLGIAYGALGNEEEIAEYKRALEIDPDFVLAYLNWGGALYSKGRYEEAIQVYRQGINVNPLMASLHYSLGVALEQAHHAEEAKAEMALAQKIDPNAGAH